MTEAEKKGPQGELSLEYIASMLKIVRGMGTTSVRSGEILREHALKVGASTIIADITIIEGGAREETVDLIAKMLGVPFNDQENQTSSNSPIV